MRKVAVCGAILVLTASIHPVEPFRPVVPNRRYHVKLSPSETKTTPLALRMTSDRLQMNAFISNDEGRHHSLKEEIKRLHEACEPNMGPFLRSLPQSKRVPI
jgi:hypothetical protein